MTARTGIAIGLLLSAAAIACAKETSGPPVGISERSSGGVRHAAADAGARTAAGLIPDYRATFKKLGDPRPAQGHSGWVVEVYANDLAARAIAARAADAPVGATAIAVHREKGSEHDGPLMMMQKRAKGYAPEHGDWRYTVVSSAGDVEGDGSLSPCFRCHDDSPIDALFPIVD